MTMSMHRGQKAMLMMTLTFAAKEDTVSSNESKLKVKPLLLTTMSPSAVGFCNYAARSMMELCMCPSGTPSSIATSPALTPQRMRNGTGKQCHFCSSNARCSVNSVSSRAIRDS